MDDPLRVICQAEGVFLRAEALDCGYDDKTLARARRAGQIVRVRQGAYTFGDVWGTLTPEERHLVLARAVLRTTPGPVALTHTTALLAHGVAVWGTDLRRVHVTRLDKGSGRVRSDVAHHVGVCKSADVVLVDGLPTVSPARAVLESATALSLEAALVSADSALHGGLTTPDELHQLFGTLNHWRGSQKIHVVLHHMDGRAESPGETRSRYLFWRQGLPRPVLQYEVYDEHGTLVAITDFAWPEHRLFGEFDGRVKYGRLLRPGESPGDAVFREKRREDLVREITRWGCGRVIWPELQRPRETAARFAVLLGIAA